MNFENILFSVRFLIISGKKLIKNHKIGEMELNPYWRISEASSQADLWKIPEIKKIEVSII